MDHTEDVENMKLIQSTVFSLGIVIMYRGVLVVEVHSNVSGAIGTQFGNISNKC